MTSANKVRGNQLEREVVKRFQKNNLEAARAWGSNGQALGHHEEVDVLLKYSRPERVVDNGLKQGTDLEELKIQCKRKKKLPDWLGFTEHVDAVVTREDRGETYIMFKLDDFIKRFLSWH